MRTRQHTEPWERGGGVVSWGGILPFTEYCYCDVGIFTFNPHSNPTHPSIHPTNILNVYAMSDAMLSNEVECIPLHLAEIGTLLFVSQQFGGRDGIGNQMCLTSLGISFPRCYFSIGEHYVDYLELIVQVLLRILFRNLA